MVSQYLYWVVGVVRVEFAFETPYLVDKNYPPLTQVMIQLIWYVSGLVKELSLSWSDTMTMFGYVMFFVLVMPP